MTQPEPDIRRKFQLTDLDRNSNKYWQIEYWDATSRCRVVHGRVGAERVIDETRTRTYVEQKIREKLSKGYVEIDLHVPQAAPAPTPAPQVAALSLLAPKVQQLVNWVFSEAGERISQYLAVGVDALSQAQIARGRLLLALAQQQHQQQQRDALRQTVQDYYNAIPTQLPRRIEPDALVQSFCGNFAEQEDRLNQLEAALATYTAMQAPQASGQQVSQYMALGAEISLLPQSDPTYGQITDYITSSAVHGYCPRIRDIFTVNVPSERAAWESCQRGKHLVRALFHGTATHNVRHILRTGLICPKVPSNGRAFGHGIYFACQSTKSTNYCSSRGRGVPQMLFIVDVALGSQYETEVSMPNLSEPPRGYDSLWARAGRSLRFDEFIVYNAAQQTIRAVVTFDR